MSKKTVRSDPNKVAIIRLLRTAANREKASIWRRTADELGRPRRQRPSVNLSHINRATEENETVLIPGKVLGTGPLDHRIVIAADSFSAEARRKVVSAGGACLTIPELLEANPRGNGVRLMK